MMVFASQAVTLLLFVQVIGDNIETRIHRLITPAGDLGYEFGTSMTSLQSNKILIIGSPKQPQKSLYTCSYNFAEKFTSDFLCDTFIENENIVGLGTTISTLPSENTILACSDQTMFNCPNGTIEQRLIGECQSINTVTGSSYKLLTPCPTGCPLGLVADILFLMDGSGSVGSRNYKKGLDWIVQVLQQFSNDINLGNVQSGYVLFNHAVYDYTTITSRSFYDLKVSIEKLTNYYGGGTATATAIDEGVILLKNSSRTVTKVLITITDGESSNSGATTVSAFNAREDDIIMIAVGVGNANVKELGRIASGNSSSSERVMTVTSYDKLGDILDELSQVIKESASIAPEGSGNGTTELTNCQFGSSVSVTTDGVSVGAMGSYDRIGAVVQFAMADFPQVASYDHLNDTEMMEITGLAAKEIKDAYLGYSTCVGKFQTAAVKWIVSGLPRYLSRGAVLIYKRDDPLSHNFMLHPDGTSMYWQLGGYYGHSVLSTDVNNDGYDDLLVAEPLYSETTGYDEGLVFLYMNDKSDDAIANWMNQGHSPVLLRGSRASAARFGMSIVSAGDIDRNGYNDVIVGAPNEKLNEYSESSGAIYIYYSSQNGIDSNRFQRVHAESLEATKILKNFGWSVHGGLDVDDNTYPDVAVSAPSSDSVVLLKSRRQIVSTTTLTASPQVIDVHSCAASSGVCVHVTACLSAEYLDSPRGEKFSMVHTITADSLVPNSIDRRLIFESTKTDLISAADIQVGQSPPVCNTYGIRFNLQSLGTINSGGFEVTPRLQFTADLAPTHKADIMSGVLAAINSKTTDLSFNTGCRGGKCYHDLQIAATYSILMSSTPLRLDGSSRILTVTGEISNAGPENAFFLKVNISSGNLTINRVNSTCIRISDDESDSTKGQTVLQYYGGNTVLRDTMNAGSTCKFTIDFDFTRIQLSADVSKIDIHGLVYSNAGSTLAIDKDGGNNEIYYTRPVQFESNLVLQSVSAPESVFFQPPSDDTTKSLMTLEDAILGGKISNFFHRYTIYNSGPLDFGNPRVNIKWPEKTAQGYDLIYLVDIYCETTDGEISNNCSCDKEKVANKYAIKPSEDSQGYRYKEYTLVYPNPSDAITASDKLTCDNTVCNIVSCDISFVDRYKQLTIVAAFKPWTPSFHKEFVTAMVETSMRIIPSNLTALPIHEAESVTSTLTSYDPENPPPQPTPSVLNIGAIIGGIAGGIVLLAVAIAVMWKMGFFKSKYGTMTQDAKRSSETAAPSGEDGAAAGESSNVSKSYGSTVDLVDE